MTVDPMRITEDWRAHLHARHRAERLHCGCFPVCQRGRPGTRGCFCPAFVFAWDSHVDVGRTCFYFSSECCQLTCIRDLSKMGQKKGERKAQCDCLFFNELFVRVGRGECVRVCVCSRPCMACVPHGCVYVCVRSLPAACVKQMDIFRFRLSSSSPVSSCWKKKAIQWKCVFLLLGGMWPSE